MTELTEASVLPPLRKIALALPETVETTSFGHPTFKVKGKIFCVLETYKGELTICVKVAPDAAPPLLDDPRYFVAPYIGRLGWFSRRLAGRLEWKELAALVKHSYEQVKPIAKSQRAKTAEPGRRVPRSGSRRTG